MSVRTMARVWELSSHAGSELLMLLAIGDFADDEGEAYPSITTLAEKCRTTPRYAIKLLDALVASGELQVVKHGGVMGRGGKTNRYRILLSQLGMKTTKAVHSSSVVHQSSVVNPGTGSSEPGDNEVVHQSSPKPPVNHQESPVKASHKSGQSKRGSRAPLSGELPTWMQGLIDLWHEILPELPGVAVINTDRQQAAKDFRDWVLTSKRKDGSHRATTDEEMLAWAREFFTRARGNDFVMGRGPRSPEHQNWRCSFEYLLSAKGMQKVIEQTQTGDSQ